MAIEDAYQLVVEISKGAEKAAAAGTSIDSEAVLKNYFAVSWYFPPGSAPGMRAACAALHLHGPRCEASAWGAGCGREPCRTTRRVARVSQRRGVSRTYAKAAAGRTCLLHSCHASLP
jgi:hypothetical protein